MLEMEVVSGVLLTTETHNPTDFPITTVALEAVKWRDGIALLEQQRKPLTISQLDLKPYGEVSCFYTGPFKAAADAYPLDTPELRAKVIDAFHEGWAQIVKDGKVTPGYGGRFADGVDYARRVLNATMPADRQIRSYIGKLPRFDQNDPTEQTFYRAQLYGWQTIVGRYVGAEQYGDIVTDGVLNADTIPDGEKYGHCFNVFCRKPIVYRANDNYPKQAAPWNNYFVLDDFELKVQNGLLYRSCYYFLPA